MESFTKTLSYVSSWKKYRKRKIRECLLEMKKIHDFWWKQDRLKKTFDFLGWKRQVLNVDGFATFDCLEGGSIYGTTFSLITSTINTLSNAPISGNGIQKAK